MTLSHASYEKWGNFDLHLLYLIFIEFSAINTSGLLWKIQKWRENIRHFWGLANLLKKPKKYLDRSRLWNISTFSKLLLDVALPKKYLIIEQFFEIHTFCLVKLQKVMRKWEKKRKRHLPKNRFLRKYKGWKNLARWRLLHTNFITNKIAIILLLKMLQK